MSTHTGKIYWLIGHAPGDDSSHDAKSHAVRDQCSPNLEPHRLVEGALEAALVTHLRDFLHKQIFASRYKLYLPDEAELAAEIRREIEMLTEGKEN